MILLNKVYQYNKDPITGLYSLVIDAETTTASTSEGSPKTTTPYVYYRVANSGLEKIFPQIFLSQDRNYSFFILPDIKMTADDASKAGLSGIYSIIYPAYKSFVWQFNARYFVSLNPSIKDEQSMADWHRTHPQYGNPADPNAFFNYIWNLTPPSSFCIDIDPVDKNSIMYACNKNNIMNFSEALSNPYSMEIIGGVISCYVCICICCCIIIIFMIMKKKS